MTLSGSRAARILREILLNIAAVGGVLCIALVGLAFAFNITLIMFKTGSMSPTIPAGSVALVQEIPASDMKVGDVVTVDRLGQLPVTHRVTSIDPAAGESRTFTMRGDANATDDVEPYTATTVRLVLGSLPGLAAAIVWFSNPVVLALITLAAAALVTWAFWPRGSTPAKKVSGEIARHRAPAALGLLGLLAIVFAHAALPASPANASEVETVIQGSVLRLVSIGDPSLMGQLRPGVPVYWQVGASAHAADPGTITLTLSATGDAANLGALDVVASACHERWSGTLCASGEEMLLHEQPLGRMTGELRSLTSMPSGEERWLLFTITATTNPAPGTASTLVVHANGVGEEIVSNGTTGGLANTGALGAGALPLAGATIATGLCIALLVEARQRKRR